MKNKKDKDKKTIKGFKAVEFMREIREKISNDIKDLSFEQIKTYFKKRKAEFSE